MPRYERVTYDSIVELEIFMELPLCLRGYVDEESGSKSVSSISSCVCIVLNKYQRATYIVHPFTMFLLKRNNRKADRKKLIIKINESNGLSVCLAVCRSITTFHTDFVCVSYVRRFRYNVLIWMFSVFIFSLSLFILKIHSDRTLFFSLSL